MKIVFPKADKFNTIERYSSRYRVHGYSEKSLGWDKGKQEVRFDVLTSQYDFTGKSVLDIGCGFGDLNKTLKRKYSNTYSYLGVDIVPDLICEAKTHYESNKISFIVGDFLSLDFGERCDYVIASGVFNYKLSAANNYEIIDAAIEKALSLCRDGIAFDFLSDKVDYRLEHTFHSAPEKILEIAYKYSRNIVLRNDYMPFEFSIFIFKDDSFSASNTLFNKYNQHA